MLQPRASGVKRPLLAGLSAPGRFRCAEILEELSGQQALGLKHHVLQEPRLSVFGSEGEQEAQPETAGGTAPKALQAAIL